MLACHNRLTKLRHNSGAQVVISEIPAADLEKSPAPILPYNHIPHHEPFAGVSISSSIDLPDYFSTVQNTYKDHQSVAVEIWSEDVDNESPPPSYEQALYLSGLAATASDVETHFEHEYVEDTRL